MAGPTNLVKATILVVEDDPCALQFLAGQLRRLGYQVVEARSAAKALEVLSLDDEGFDLLLADVVLPDEPNGIELARRARRAFGAGLKVLLTSAYPKEDLAEQYGSLDANMPLLTKPYTREDLTAALHTVFGSPAPASASFA
jgi:CheY-like chemotaxis protein